MIKKPLSRRTPPAAVVVRSKPRRRQMLSPDALAAEERRYQIKKLLAQSPRLNSHLATQLCMIPLPGSDTSCLTQFDEILMLTNQGETTEPRSERGESATLMIGDINRLMAACEEQLATLKANTGSITLHSNLSARPVIFPEEPHGRHKSLMLESTFVRHHALLAKLQRFDGLICDALLLRKFGFLDATQWDALITPITQRWRDLFHICDRRGEDGFSRPPFTSKFPRIIAQPPKTAASTQNQVTTSVLKASSSFFAQKPE